jgi:hypothetical protein
MTMPGTRYNAYNSSELVAFFVVALMADNVTEARAILTVLRSRRSEQQSIEQQLKALFARISAERQAGVIDIVPATCDALLNAVGSTIAHVSDGARVVAGGATWTLNSIFELVSGK